MKFVGKASIYRNKTTGRVLVVPFIRHPVNGAPTEHGPVVHLDSLDSGKEFLRAVWDSLAKYDQPYRPQDEVRRSSAEHRSFNKQHDMVVTTVYADGSVEVLPFRYDEGQHVADKSDVLTLNNDNAKKELLRTLREAFRHTK